MLSSARNITDIAMSRELGSLWSTVTYLQTPALLAGMVLRTMFNPNMMVSANLRTEQICIHQSMDTTPVVNIANVDPFANHPLALNNQTSVPGMEFTCVTADFTGALSCHQLPACAVYEEHRGHETLHQHPRRDNQRPTNHRHLGYGHLDAQPSRSSRIHLTPCVRHAAA